MKKLYSLLLALVMIFGLCTTAMAAESGGYVVKTQEVGVNTIAVTIRTDHVGMKNGRIVFSYPEELNLVSTEVLVPSEDAITDLDASGTVSFSWAAYETQKDASLLELVFTGENGAVYEALLQTPEDGGSFAVTLAVPYRFLDVQNPEVWYYEAVYTAYDLGLMEGVGKDLFAPGQTLNRATVATVLYRMAGCPAAKAEAPFTDVADNTWYTDAVRWASEAGVAEGYGNGIFAPNRAVTRQELVTMFHRFRQYQGGTEAVDLSVLDRFQDASAVSAWAVEAMAWAVENEIVSGMSATVLEPQSTAIRAQVAQILCNYQNLE